ncbi:MFS transporter [Paraglaciecola sp.]|uniref:MFS transporter n=1 Tax=Paraglaciecola sp. TaxID=1920173 RepID=UPI003EF4C6EB
MLAAIITLVMPYFLIVFEPNQIFLFFTFMMVLQLVFVIKLMPETKGKPLEEINSRI